MKKIDTLEFDCNNGKKYLAVNGERMFICSHAQIDCRVHLLTDYVLCLHLQRIKHHNINLYDNPPTEIHEVEEVMAKIGLEFQWSCKERLLIQFTE